MKFYNHPKYGKCLVLSVEQTSLGLSYVLLVTNGVDAKRVFVAISNNE